MSDPFLPTSSTANDMDAGDTSPIPFFRFDPGPHKYGTPLGSLGRVLIEHGLVTVRDSAYDNVHDFIANLMVQGGKSYALGCLRVPNHFVKQPQAEEGVAHFVGYTWCLWFSPSALESVDPGYLHMLDGRADSVGAVPATDDWSDPELSDNDGSIDLDIPAEFRVGGIYGSGDEQGEQGRLHRTIASVLEADEIDMELDDF